MIRRHVAGGPELLAHEVEMLPLPLLVLPALLPPLAGDHWQHWSGPGTLAHHDHCSGHSLQCPHSCCQLRHWTGWRDIRTCSCSSVSPCPSGERKPARGSQNNILSPTIFSLLTFPHDGHLWVPLWMCLWCCKLPGCLNSLPHSSQEYLPAPPLVLRALLTQSKHLLIMPAHSIKKY